MSARDRILARLTQAQTETLTQAQNSLPLPDLGQWTPVVPAAGSEERLDRFKTLMRAAHAEVHDTDEQAWPGLLLELARHKNVRTLLVGTGTESAARLKSYDSETLHVMSYERPADQWRADFFEQVDAGFTQAKSGIAATGSLVLWPSRMEPRLLSLIPPIHFVLLDARALHADLREAMQVEQWATRMPTNALVISGPSKTADIQQTLAYGAHGPKELIVLLCHPRENS